MNASELNRNLPQYQELFEIDTKDEFLHCFAYELAIRSIKDKLEEELEAFYIKDNEIGLKSEELEKIAKEIEHKNIKHEYIEIIEDIAKMDNLSPIDKACLYKIEKLEDDISFELGLILIDLYVEYSFFSDSFKKIFNKLFKTASDLFFNKNLYHGAMKSDAYYHENFIRTHTFLPLLRQNDTFRDIRTHYTLRYRRPMFHGTILCNNKKADITINADLPKEIIMQQFEKLINIIQKDKKNIFSNRDKVALADEIKNYERYANEAYKNKRMYIDGLIIFDYLEARSKEIAEENKEITKIKKQKINYINQSINMLKNEKREQIKQINRAYKKITQKDIKEEIAQKLGLDYKTVEKYRKLINISIEDKNFLKLINGQDIKGFIFS